VAVGIFLAALLGPIGPVALSAEGDKAAARAHYETASRLYEVREYAEALKEFKSAYVSRPDPVFLFNIGQCLRKLDRNSEALDFFQQFLKKTAPDDRNRAAAEARIRDIETGHSSDPESSAKTDASTPSGVSPAVALPVPAAVIPAPQVSQPAGVDLSVPASTGEPPASKPIYRKWWFWTGVGAVVVAGAVTAAVLASGGNSTSVPGSSLGARPVFP
jgi:tetratricopeptide (TPR) repeat protein